jgi:hypothetical protein
MQMASVRWAVQRRQRVATLWLYDAPLQSDVSVVDGTMVITLRAIEHGKEN